MKIAVGGVFRVMPGGVEIYCAILSLAIVIVIAHYYPSVVIGAFIVRTGYMFLLKNMYESITRKEDGFILGMCT